jgi:hypothetical protein
MFTPLGVKLTMGLCSTHVVFDPRVVEARRREPGGIHQPVAPGSVGLLPAAEVPRATGVDFMNQFRSEFTNKTSRIGANYKFVNITSQ